MRLRLLVAVAALSSASLAAHADLTGNTVSCDETSSNSVYVCSSSTAVVGPGVEFTFPDGSATITEDFSANSVVLSFGAQNFAVTNIVNTDLTSPFTDYTVEKISGFTGLSASNVSLSGGKLDIDLVGSSSSQGASITIGLTTAATPEPSSIALLGSGLLGVVGVARRRFV